jgi:hypothetical protein
VIRVDRTAYISEPVWARWSQEGLYLWGYVLMFVAGFAAVTGLDFPAREAGWFVMGGALVSAAGVLTRFYHVEALGLYPIIFGLGVCVVWLVIPPQNAVLTGWLVAAYVPFLGVRLLALNLVALDARREARNEH